jgi:hypothetical protein
LRLTADGVIFLFSSAGHVGEVMHIVVMNVVLQEHLKIKEKHREDIAKPQREKRITGKQKTVVDTVLPPKNK